MTLIKNEPRLFVLSNNKTINVVLYDKNEFLSENYVYLLSVEHVAGEGSIRIFNKNRYSYRQNNTNLENIVILINEIRKTKDRNC